MKRTSTRSERKSPRFRCAPARSASTERPGSSRGCSSSSHGSRFRRRPRCGRGSRCSATHLVPLQLNVAMTAYALPTTRGAEEDRHGEAIRPTASPDPRRAGTSRAPARRPLALGAHPPAVSGRRRGASGRIDRRSRRARRLPLHPGVRLGAALQRVGVSDLRARHQPERSPRDHAARAAARAGGDRAFEPQRARAAVHQLVGGQARGVLPKETGAARHQRGVGAPPFAPRGPQCPAGEDLEGLDRPALRRKKGGIRRLYERRPPRARVICFDEFGPLELRPAGGSVWARRREPARVRATYHRGGGTRTLLAFYDVHAGALGGIFRRRWRLFVVLDNLRHIHDSPRFLALLRRLRITPVFTPTEASWLNLIEAQFGALKRATLTNTDDPDHASRQRRSYRDLRYRHRELGIRGHALERLHSIRGIKLERH